MPKQPSPIWIPTGGFLEGNLEVHSLLPHRSLAPSTSKFESRCKPFMGKCLRGLEVSPRGWFVWAMCPLSKTGYQN